MTKPNRPESATKGVYLLYIALIIGLIIGLIKVFTGEVAPAGMPQPGLGFSITVLVVSLAVAWFFIHMIATGRNWARILYLVFFIITIVCWVIGFRQLMLQGVLSIVGNIVALILAVIALVFLFKPASNAWFKSKGSSSEPTSNPPS